MSTAAAEAAALIASSANCPPGWSNHDEFEYFDLGCHVSSFVSTVLYAIGAAWSVINVGVIVWRMHSAQHLKLVAPTKMDAVVYLHWCLLLSSFFIIIYCLHRILGSSPTPDGILSLSSGNLLHNFLFFLVRGSFWNFFAAVNFIGVRLGLTVDPALAKAHRGLVASYKKMLGVLAIWSWLMTFITCFLVWAIEVQADHIRSIWWFAFIGNAQLFVFRFMFSAFPALTALQKAFDTRPSDDLTSARKRLKLITIAWINCAIQIFPLCVLCGTTVWPLFYQNNYIFVGMLLPVQAYAVSVVLYVYRLKAQNKVHPKGASKPATSGANSGPGSSKKTGAGSSAPTKPVVSTAASGPSADP